MFNKFQYRLITIVILFTAAVSLYADSHLKEKSKRNSKFSFSIIKELDKYEAASEAEKAKSDVQMDRTLGTQPYEMAEDDLALKEAEKKEERGLITVQIECVSSKAAQTIRSDIIAYGGEVPSMHSYVITARLPADKLKSIAYNGGVKRIKRPLRPIQTAIEGEQVSLIAADTAHSDGYKGSGVTVAVIDTGFTGITAAEENGELPEHVYTHQLSYDGGVIGKHGTGVLEIVHETAPEATLYALKVSYITDLGNAVDYCIRNGIDIINMSLVWPGTGIGDGSGYACEVVNYARDNGILFVTSTGNYAQRHYQAEFNDSDGNGYHEFASGDEYNIIQETYYGDDIYIHLYWNDEWYASENDYDVELYKDSGSGYVRIAGSYEAQNGSPSEPVEEIVDNASSDTAVYAIRIKKGSSSAKPKTLKLFCFAHELEYKTENGSLLSPGDAAGALSVGALSYDGWTDDDEVDDYSSRGPTFDGRIKPDIVGVAGMTNFTYPDRFYGTSAAAPAVAGAAAVLMSAGGDFKDIRLVKTWLMSNAVDGGVSGADNEFGSGKLNLSGCPAFPQGLSFNPPELSIVSHSEMDFVSRSFWINYDISDADSSSFNVRFLSSENNDFEWDNWQPIKNVEGDTNMLFSGRNSNRIFMPGNSASSSNITAIVVVVSDGEWETRSSEYSAEMSKMFSAQPNLDNVKVVNNPFVYGKSSTDEGVCFVNLQEGSRIKIFTVSRALVRSLESEPGSIDYQNGVIRWDLKNSFGDYVSSGVYLCYVFNDNLVYKYNMEKVIVY